MSEAIKAEKAMREAAATVLQTHLIDWCKAHFINPVGYRQLFECCDKIRALPLFTAEPSPTSPTDSRRLRQILDHPQWFRELCESAYLLHCDEMAKSVILHQIDCHISKESGND